MDTSYLRAGARGVTDRTATGLEGSLMEHTDAGVRATPPVGLWTRADERAPGRAFADVARPADHLASNRDGTVQPPAPSLGQRPSVPGMPRPPAPRPHADTHASAELRLPAATAYAGRDVPDSPDVAREPGAVPPSVASGSGYAAARRADTVADAGALDEADTDDLDEDDEDEDVDQDEDSDDDLVDVDDELAGAGLTAGGQPRDGFAADDGTGRPLLADVIDIGLGDLLGEVMEWQERALCAQTDPEAFFPEKGGSTREAKRICSGCEVRTECLEYALANDERFGIWGGMSERERRKQRRRAV